MKSKIILEDSTEVIGIGLDLVQNMCLSVEIKVVGIAYYNAMKLITWTNHDILWNLDRSYNAIQFLYLPCPNKDLCQITSSNIWRYDASYVEAIDTNIAWSAST